MDSFLKGTKINEITDHLFRRESAKMVSVLTSILGNDHFDLAEDVVQETLLQALKEWRFKGVPDNPSGWLFTVAKNKALDVIRRDKKHIQLSAALSDLIEERSTQSNPHPLFEHDYFLDEEIKMMFVCANPDLPQESQIAIILKVLCGFNNKEIANAFLISPIAVEKRLTRAKEMLRETKISFNPLSEPEVTEKTQTVLMSLYLLFNEGYNSSISSSIIREELMDEAIRLTAMLLHIESTSIPETYALLSLMLFHYSRTKSRLDETGNIILLKHQNRSRWDQSMISLGLNFYRKSLYGNNISKFHIESSIALEHIKAETYEKTDWNQLIHLYDMLYSLEPSPIVALNRAVVYGEVYGPDYALKSIFSDETTSNLKDSHFLFSVIGELYLMKNDINNALISYEKSLVLCKSEKEKFLIISKINDIIEKNSNLNSL
ncbi:MAG: sigma-70 family RNA polymerase sigma factor [Chloroherpetonaceae bacterium]|nr:sigma-70 family RNA polymerase sigma factor [Chloroherpetonaceae bacterium]